MIYRKQVYDYVIKQGNNWPPIHANLHYIDDSFIDLSDAFRVEIIITKRNDRNNLLVRDEVKIVNLATSEVEYYFPGGKTAAAGEYQFEFVIYYNDGAIDTIPREKYYYLYIHHSLDFERKLRVDRTKSMLSSITISGIVIPHSNDLSGFIVIPMLPPVSDSHKDLFSTIIVDTI